LTILQPQFSCWPFESNAKLVLIEITFIPTLSSLGGVVDATMAKLITTYQINALGQRNRKTNSVDDRIFIYDVRGRLISEVTTAGGVLREYIYVGDVPVAVLQ